ncbi:MAG: IS4 family transposase [Bacteroidota bacterium]|nr:IS4 family transposase [Bacteroidota bacterium]
MNKSSFFSGQPLLGQILKLIPEHIFRQVVKEHDSDRYYKKFRTYEHFVTMLYSCMHDCTSLRELVTGMQAHYNKLGHLDVACVPRRSTLSDANNSRDARFFESLFFKLHQYLFGVLPDSLKGKSPAERIFLMDSTTISLFSDIMRGAGMYGADGRKKGGAKAHVLLKMNNLMPEIVFITDAKENDRIFMNHIDLPKGAILVFDRGYETFSQWDEWTQKGITWVTMLKAKNFYNVLADRPVKESEEQKGVLSDSEIMLGRGTKNTTKIIRARLVTYVDFKTGDVFEFLTNNFRFSPSTIAAFYKKRWAIESFFKQYKQNNPVKYFLGDSINAIKIQLWVAFIKELLVRYIKDQLKRKWSYANLSSMIRHHLMNYINLFAFLNDPDRTLIKLLEPNKTQLYLFPT